MNTMALTQVLSRFAHMQDPPALMIWGPPGVGKSQVVRDLARNLGWGHCDVRLPDHSPVDLKGVPVPDLQRGITRWLPNGLLPVAERDGERGFLVLEEAPSAPPAVQVCAYQLTLDRRVGEYVVPPGWLVILTGNREEDRGLVYRMLAPLANRLVHVEVEPDLQSWKEWAYRAGVDGRVIAFLDFRPGLLYSAPATPATKAFPTPRSWEFVSRLLKGGFSPADLEVFAGAVGEGAATEFIAFLRVHEEIPDTDAILEGRSREVPPADRPDIRYALMGALVERLMRGTDAFEARARAFVAYISLLGRELAVCAFHNAYMALPHERRTALVRSPEAQDLALAISELFA